jgi:hypothetical protein
MVRFTGWLGTQENGRHSDGPVSQDRLTFKNPISEHAFDKG